MEGQHTLRPHEFHIFEQIVITRVIAERECGVHLVTVHRTRCHSPSGQHGDPLLLDCGQHARSFHAGRGDEHMTRNLGGIIRDEVGKSRHQIAVDTRQFGHRAVKHRLEPGGGHGANDFLRFAQRVTEQDRHLVVLQGLATEFHHLGQHLLGRRKNKLRFAEGGFHDESPGLPPLGALAGKTRTQFEIPGVEQRSVVGLQVQLRRPVDMARREQSELHPAHLPRLPELEHMFHPRRPLPRAHQPRCPRCEHRLAMLADMIAVRMRDKSEPPRRPRIHPQIDRWHKHPAAICHLNHAPNLPCSPDKHSGNPYP